MLRLLFAVLILAGCNSVYIKPGTLDKTDVIYVERGGYTIQHAIKQRLEKRGYNVTVGYKKATTKTTYIESADSQSIISASDIGKSRYIVEISERSPAFRPIWCVFNGFWWWNFNVSVADNLTGQEILGWSGRGCANSSLRKLDAILDNLEVK